MINKNDAIKKRLVILDNTNTLEDEKTSLLEKIKQLIPNLVNSDNTLNLSALEDLIGLSNTTANNQGYELTFAGKGLAKAKAEIATDKELKVELAQSKNFDDTENIIIRGDNLDVLKILKQNYSEKVKMIYIDPPYNTKSDNFIYNDDFRQNEQGLIEKFGLPDTTIDYLQNIYGTKTHSAWLSFMYPRLKLARDLLKDDGVIFISIDDNECANLKIICDEIFGEENTDVMIWNKVAEGSSGNLKQTLRLRNIHEYILVVYKFKNDIVFSKISEFVAGKEALTITANLAVNVKNQKENHKNWMEIKSPTGKVWNKQWKFSNEEIRRLQKEGLLYYGKDGAKQPRLIMPMDERRKVYSTSIINKGGTTIGRKDYEENMPAETFSFPKPICLINHLMQITTSHDDIILDFFAGSGTTAHAVMDLNKADGGKRKFILVQWDEKIDEKQSKPAYDFCIKNKFEPVISSITIERVNRAGEKLSQEAGLLADNLDIGYKVFSLMDKTRINIQDDQHSLITQRTNTLETLYNMMVATSQPLHSKIEEIEKDALYKINNSYYVINNFKTKIETLKDAQIYIDAYSNISLEQYLNVAILNRKDISVVY